MMVRQVAEIVHLRRCFSLRPRRPPTLDVLTDASAAERVLRDGTPAVVWLDIKTESLFMTERWGSDVVKQRLPLQLDVVVLPQPVRATDEEVTVAAIAFKDRTSLELFVKLGLHVLPDWLSLRQSALGKNLLLANGHWMLSYQGKALRLQWSGGRLSGLLELNVSKACIELLIADEHKPIRAEAVSSLQMAAKTLHKHSMLKLQLDKTVQHAIQSLQPSPACLRKLKSQLEASLHSSKGASMAGWIDGGIVAALVDCAASLPQGSSLQQQQGQQLQEHHKQDEHSMLQSITDCICFVLRNAAEQADWQAQVLFECITRSLCDSRQQAVQAAKLLGMMLHQLTDANNCPLQSLQKACQGPLLVQQLLHCYSWTLRQQTLAPAKSSGGIGPHSHPVPADPEPDQPATYMMAADTTPVVKSSSDPGSHSKRPPMVPRLSLPSSGPATPTVLTRSSRLSRRVSDISSSTWSAAESMPQVAAVSFLAALQQLGHSCGESVMAADLAAFVTHKQLHSGQALSNRNSQRVVLPPADTLADYQAPPQQLTFDQLCSLPSTVQLQLQLLECMSFLLDQLPAYVLPAAVGNLLLGQLLLASSHAEQHLKTEGHRQQESQLLDMAMKRQRHVAMQLVVRCSASKQQQPAVSGRDDAQNMGLRLHDSVLAQFKQQLLDYSSTKRPDASTHAACKEALLLLRDYLHLSGVPGLVDTACCVVGNALIQLEHMLRGSRVWLWSWPAVLHMDALVQVYVKLIQQARSPYAVNYLLQLLGTKQTASTPKRSCGGDTSSRGPAAAIDTAAGALPADTLQLVLEFLQQRLSHSNNLISCSGSGRCSDGHEAVAGSPAGAGLSRLAKEPAPFPPNAAAVVFSSSRSLCSAQCQPAGQSEEASGTDIVAVDAEAVEAAAIKSHCWQLLTALLQLAAKHTTSWSAGSASSTNSLSCFGASSPSRTSSLGSEGLLHNKPQAAVGLMARHLAREFEGVSQDEVQQRMHVLPPSASGARSTPVLPPCSADELRCPASSSVISVGLPSPSSSASSTGQKLLSSCKAVMTGSGTSAFGSCELLKVLVELLMRQRGGHAFVVQQLDELDASQVALPLQLELLKFLAVAFAVPESYPWTVPQLTEFYVHYHFLHFIRHYYKLPSAFSPASVACCKGHAQVLLALCRHGGGANLVRRRFLQLKVLEFLIREVSLEHSLCRRRHTCSGNSSFCSTPQSTARGTGPCSGAAGNSATSSAVVAAGLCRASKQASQHHSDPGSFGVAGRLGSVTAPCGSVDGGVVPGGSLLSMEDMLTERGISGLLSSSFSSSKTADASGQPSQPSGAADGCQAQASSSILSGSNTSSPSSVENCQCLACTTGSRTGSCPHSRGAVKRQHHNLHAEQGTGTVQSAVELFEAAAAAAVVAASPPRPTPVRGHRLPGSRRLVVLAAASPGVAGSNAVGSGAAGMVRREGKQPVLPLRPTPPPVPRPAGPHCSTDLASTAATAEPGTVNAPAVVLGNITCLAAAGAAIAAAGGSQTPAAAAVLAAPAQRSCSVDDARKPPGQQCTVSGGAAAAICSSPCSQSIGMHTGSSWAASSHEGRHSRQGFDSKVPGSVCDRQQLQQPQLTGDASVDAQLIDEWEEHTGLDFMFDGLSDEEQDAGSQHNMIDRGCMAGRQAEIKGPWGSPIDGCTQPPVVRRVPRLALGLQQVSSGAPTASAFSGAVAAGVLREGGSRSAAAAHAEVVLGSSDDSSNCNGPNSYRPGLNLEDDFERLISAEESGRQHSWAFSNDGSSSDSSSLSAAGRDVIPEQQQLLPVTQFGAVRSDRPVSVAVAAVEGGSRRVACWSSQHDIMSVHGSDAGARRCPGKVHAGTSTTAAAWTDAVTVEGGAGGCAAAAAAGGVDCDVGSSSSSLSEDVPLEDVVGLHEEEEDEQQQQQPHGNASAVSPLQAKQLICRNPPKRVLVPLLNLPAASNPMRFPASSTAAPDSSSSSRSSVFSTARAMAPSLLATATPLITTRTALRTPSKGRALQQLSACHLAAATQKAATQASALAVYYCQRQACAVYADPELHVLCLELALHLLGTPSGLLDPLQLPQEPTDNSLQHKVLVLLGHLSQTDNISIVQMLADRARVQIHPAPACQGHAILRTAPGNPATDSSCGGRTGGCSGAGTTTTAEAAVVAGQGCCTLRLLKLLSTAMSDPDRLQLGGMIQKGAFSEIQAATLHHAGQHLPVAVKVLNCGDGDSSCFERVYNEVTILENLRGREGVVPLLDYGVTFDRSGGDCCRWQPQWHLVFPRYHGSLRDWRRMRGQGLQPRDIDLHLRIFIQVAIIVRDLHAANVVHCDIKGDNLLLSSECTRPSMPFDVVLADFGDALVLDSCSGGVGAFAQRHRGTELFSSPEMLLLHAGQQNKGHEQHDRRKHRGVGRPHDVWSLGCTLYELMTGMVLFEQEGVGRITSYATSGSCAKRRPAATTANSSQHNQGSIARAVGGSIGVLTSRERAALGHHAGLIELVEFMLVGEATWRPGASEVVYKAGQLLASLSGRS